MYARAGAGPPAILTLSKNVLVPSGIESSCGTPTRPTAPPTRTISIAVTVDSSCPTHSSTEWAPRPSVSSFTRSTASSPRSLTISVAPNSCGERDPVLVVAEHDDPLGAEPLRRDHAAQADGAVADDRHGLAGANLGGERCVVARRHHVREREQRRHQRVVLVDRKRDERPVRLRHAHGFALAAVDSVHAVAAAVQARRVQPFAAEDARAVGPHERRDHEVALLDRLDVVAGLLDHADELVSHAAARRGRLHLLVRPKVAPADRGTRHGHDRVGRIDEPRVGHVLDAHISGCIHHGCAHLSLLSGRNDAKRRSADVTSGQDGTHRLGHNEGATARFHPRAADDAEVELAGATLDPR